MKDPYEILGVQRSDNEAAIRAAYRKLAKRHHPDVNPGKPEALERFKEISTAYDLLSDKEKRTRFDRGEIDAEGHEVPPERPFYRDFQQGAGQERYQTNGGFTQEDIEAFFSQAFNQTGTRGGHAGGRSGAGFAARGRDMQYGLTVSFVDAANGTTRRLALPDGKTLDVRIPPGTEDGHVLRLRGQGGPGIGGAVAGDTLIEITVAPDHQFHREGDDIIVDLPVTLQEAVLGGSLEVPTIRGPVRLTVPPGSGTGTRLRLRGRGIRDGHQFVQLQVVVPPGDEPELAAFLKGWTPSNPFKPREGS
jgi:DnaJ-class molecular chaperone